MSEPAGSDAGLFSDAPSSWAVTASSSPPSLSAPVDSLEAGPRRRGCARPSPLGEIDKVACLLAERLTAWPPDDGAAELSDGLDGRLEVLRRLGAEVFMAVAVAELIEFNST